VSPGQQVRDALLNSAAVQAIAGTRIYPMRLPPNATFPAVVYTVISKIPVPAFGNATAGTLKQSRLQVDSYAREYDDAQDLAGAIEDYLTALTGAGITVEFADSRDLFENDTQLHRVNADFIVWSA
jgi:hypothetical protein